MSSFPGSPQVQKGAIVGLDPFNPLASVIVFQYNPDTLTRTLTAQATGGQPNSGEALRLKGPPQETITVNIEIDAVDQIGQAPIPSTSLGVHPALAALEMLLYPKSALVIANEILMQAGVIEIIPPEAPLTLFIWGVKRVVPVRLTTFTITEEAFDTALNPIRAKVTLGLRVLNYQDLGLLSAGGSVFMAHQVIKEVMAAIGSVGNIGGAASAAIGGGLSIG
ncbi:MAG: hypothetical protein ACHQO8_03110 [Vicinamibacterales bacterium]